MKTASSIAFVRVCAATAIVAAVAPPIDAFAETSSQCERPAIAIKRVTPDYPKAANGATGLVQIKFTLNDKGELLSTSVYKSSSNAALDEAAENAARQSTYAPGYHECKPVGGSWLFTVDFSRSH